jgi:hypothetical protein
VVRAQTAEQNGNRRCGSIRRVRICRPCHNRGDDKPVRCGTSIAGSNQFNTAAPNTVTVNAPVCTVSNVNCTVQVVLTDQVNTLFGHMFLPATVNIATTATAAYQTLTNSSGNPVGQTCLMALSTITFNGNPGFEAENCTFAALDTSNHSIDCNGCNGHSWDTCGTGGTDPCVGAVVTAGGFKNDHIPPQPRPPFLSQQSLTNPYANLTASPITPVPSGPCNVSGTTTISTGTVTVPSNTKYCGLIINGTANVTLPANYYIGSRGITIGGSARVTFGGTTYIGSGGVNIGGSPVVTFSAGLYYLAGGPLSITGLTSSASISGTAITL